MNAKKISMLAVVFLVAAALTMPVLARQGGMNSGDYAWGSCGCHSNLGPISVAIAASASTLDPGQWVNVTVHLTGSMEGEEEEAGKVGVLLFSALSRTNSLPSEGGWVVVKDPSGSTAFNYYEINNYLDSAQLQWSLLAPQTPGQYSLYVQVMHGADDRPSYEEGAPLLFTVKGNVPAPVVTITAPSPGAVLTGTVQVSADVFSADPTTTATMYFDDIALGTKTAAPFTWQLNTAAYADGLHKIRVEASNSNPTKGVAQVSVVLNNNGQGLNNANIIVIRAPFNNTLVTGPFFVAAEVVGGGTMLSGTLYIDGASQGTKTTQPYNWTIDSSQFSNGVHIINVTARGATANGSDEITVRTDNSVPAVIITNLAPGQQISGIYTVLATITAPAPVVRAQLYIDGTLVGNLTSGSWAYMMDTTTYADGTHTVNITAYDGLGRSGSASVDVIFQNTPSFDKAAWEMNMIALPIFMIGIICMLVTAALYLNRTKEGEK